MELIVELLASIPSSAFAAVGAALGVSALLEAVKKWLSVQSDKIITTLLGFFSFSAVALESLLSATAANPALLGAEAMVIVGVAQFMYRFLIKPGSNLLHDAREYRARRENAAHSDTAVGAVTVPDELVADELPLEDVVPQPVVENVFE